MALVVDAPVVLAWLLPDESNAIADGILNRWVEGEALWAPELLRYEVCNTI